MVLFDVSCLDQKNISGVGIYSKSLLAALRAQGQFSIQPVYKFSRWRQRHTIQEHTGVRATPYAPWTLPLRRYDFDLFHGPDFKIPPDFRHAKILTVHDLAVFDPTCTDARHAARRQQNLRQNILKHRPEAVLFPSEFSRRQFQKHFPESKARLFVTPLGGDHLSVPSTLGPNLIGSPYILYVGAIELRKNVSQVVAAFEALRSRPQHADLKLVVVGHTGFGGEALVQQMVRSKVAADILRMGYVEPKNLHALYQHALFFCYPSLYEGFGIPVLEAMKHGCPVLTSRDSAMTEVTGSAALAVNPRNRDELIEASHQLLVSDRLRADLRSQGLARAARFTWENCARLTAEAYQDVLS